MYRKLTLFLLIIICICSSILIHKIEKNKDYDEELFNRIYEENDDIMENKPSSNNKVLTQKRKKNVTGAYYISGNISIPEIDISYPIIEETSMKNLKIAPCKLAGPDANEVGNLCIVGHNYKNSEQFSKIHKLNNGDIIEITDLNKCTKKYKVYDKYEIKPDQLDCLNQDTKGKCEVTLITCAKNNKKRLVLKCAEEYKN